MPEDFIAAHFSNCMPREATGVVLFDILIANPDRHPGNLAVDSPTHPTQFEMIDHDRALFGDRENGEQRLANLIGTTTLALGGGHEILKTLSTSEYMEEWIQRIEAIPDCYIESVCRESLELGISVAECDTATAYIKERKRQIREVVRANKAQFRSIRRWSLLL